MPRRRVHRPSFPPLATDKTFASRIARGSQKYATYHRPSRRRDQGAAGKLHKYELDNLLSIVEIKEISRKMSVGEARPPRQERNGRGQPAPGHFDCEKVHQSRPAVPRPYSGRQHRPDEGGRQVRIPPRLQFSTYATW